MAQFPPLEIAELIARAHVANRHGPAPYGPGRDARLPHGEDRRGTKRK